MIETVFVSIVLNEAEYIERNLQQHIEFCDQWIIVEGADRRYPADAVTQNGLSKDHTADIIRDFGSNKLRFIQHGWAESKEVLRSVYADLIPSTARCVIVFDADEFLSRCALSSVISTVSSWDKPGVFRIPHVHYWKKPTHIITGGYFDIPHNRIYRWAPGSRYVQNHNHPELPDGTFLHAVSLTRHYRNLMRLPRDGKPVDRVQHPGAFFHHFGFCKQAQNMRDKNAFYVARGEAQTRKQTIRNREAWFKDGVPDGCCLYRWAGQLPEVFQKKGKP